MMRLFTRMLCTLFAISCALHVLSARAELSQDEKNALLAQHNAWRAQYEISPLVWDETVAAFAQQWADQLAAAGSFEHRQGNDYGENLWAGTAGQFSMVSVVDGWGNERDHYDVESNSCAAGQVCGHFTQVIWRDSNKLGCGKATGADGNDVVVCNYDPAGNFQGESPFGQ